MNSSKSKNIFQFKTHSILQCVQLLRNKIFFYIAVEDFIKKHAQASFSSTMIEPKKYNLLIVVFQWLYSSESQSVCDSSNDFIRKMSLALGIGPFILRLLEWSLQCDPEEQLCNQTLFVQRFHRTNPVPIGRVNCTENLTC